MGFVVRCSLPSINHEIIGGARRQAIDRQGLASVVTVVNSAPAVANGVFDAMPLGIGGCAEAHANGLGVGGGDGDGGGGDVGGEGDRRACLLKPAVIPTVYHNRVRFLGKELKKEKKK